ncbi:MAG: hypothetical protein M3Q74_02140 [Pseudomonadota bacterium]|nr:hypothetical protein [Pseudomonadota bacterium]
MRIIEAVLVVLLIAWIPLLAIVGLLLSASLKPDSRHNPLKRGFVGLIQPEDLTPWGHRVQAVQRVLVYGFPILLIAVVLCLSR